MEALTYKLKTDVAVLNENVGIEVIIHDFKGVIMTYVEKFMQLTGSRQS